MSGSSPAMTAARRNLTGAAGLEARADPPVRLRPHLKERGV